MIKREDYPKYKEVVKNLQDYLSEKAPDYLFEKGKQKQNKTHLINFIKHYVFVEKINDFGVSEEELCQTLYDEVINYGFLTKYLLSKNVEEININSWESIEVIYRDGRKGLLNEHFYSPERAEEIMRKMLNHSGQVIDNRTPYRLGHLGNSIRIAVLKTPIVDEEVGVVASIRIVTAVALTEDKFLDTGSFTKEMMNFFKIIVKNGISVCIAGATSSGKTTLLQFFLDGVEHHKRIFTIEEGSRELNCVKRNEDGRVINSVIHTLTRPSEEKISDVSQRNLIEMALRLNPDLIVLAEIRSFAEAFFGQEASRTGHQVLTSVHASDCRGAIRRIMTLCKQESDLDKQTLIEQIVEAFPIVLHQKQYEDGIRRNTEVMECYLNEKDEVVYNTLFRFQVESNIINENGEVEIKGKHIKVNEPSENLIKLLKNNGATIEDLKCIG